MPNHIEEGWCVATWKRPASIRTDSPVTARVDFIEPGRYHWAVDDFRYGRTGLFPATVGGARTLADAKAQADAALAKHLAAHPLEAQDANPH
jgi:hypothetical protein